MSASAPRRDDHPIQLLSSLMGERALVALIGGGGKTSILRLLSSRLAERGRVLATTTTHIERRGAGRTVIGPERQQYWEDGSPSPVLTVALAELGEKLVGFPPAVIDGMYRRNVAPWIIVESDGAKGRPFKAYAEYEPVVPAETTHSVTVVGAEIFIEPVSDENTFRLSLFEERGTLKRGERLSAGRIAAILSDEREYGKCLPEHALRLLFVNKCEKLDDPLAVGDALAANLVGYDALILASLHEEKTYASVRLIRGGRG